MPFRIYGTYHIHWYVWIELPLYHILHVLLPALDFVLALEGGDTDQDHVSHPQEHCLALVIIIAFRAQCLLLPKEVGFPMGRPNVFPLFLDVLGGSGCGYQLQGKSKGDIDWELGLPPIHKEVGAETHSGILGTVLSVDQHSNTAISVGLAF